jgi:hypothetical protein
VAILLFVIVLWRESNCVKIPQGDANKSANRFDIYAPKVEKYHLQSFTILACVQIKYTSLHDFAAYFLLATAPFFISKLNSIYKFARSQKDDTTKSAILFHYEKYGVLCKF